jgi:hypothetical protein
LRSFCTEDRLPAFCHILAAEEQSESKILNQALELKELKEMPTSF